MLSHEQPEEQAKEPLAAQVRVTPEELAAAIARMEARRAGADGKIAIGDAVSELSLDATAEEVLAEVRAGQAHFQAVKPRRSFSLRRRLAVYFAAGTLALGITALVGVRTAVTAPSPESMSVSQADNLSPQPAPAQHISLDPNLLVGDRAGKMVLLSEVGDNQPVHSNYYGGGFQQYSPGQGTKWTLIKHGGKVYVRGRILKMSPAALAQDGADMYDAGDPSFVVPVTLAIQNFTVSSANSPYQSPDAAFHAQNIRLDQHAYEKW